MRQLDEQLRSLVEEAAQRKAAKAIENGEFYFSVLQNFKVEFFLIDHFFMQPRTSVPASQRWAEPQAELGPGAAPARKGAEPQHRRRGPPTQTPP